MPELEGPEVVLRGPAEGDSIILPMGGLHAHITRKASRTETGGHWAFGEAWQDPGFDNPPHTHDEAEAFYVSKARTPSTRTPLPRRASDQARSSSFRLARYTGSELARKAGVCCASGRRASRPRSS